MLRPVHEVTEDARDVRSWALTWCFPEPPEPAAAAMRTRSFAGPPDTPETGPLRYTQQVAAFGSVDEAVAEAARLLERADACGAASGEAGPHVSDLPVGAQGRLVVFAEGGDYSISGMFRRGNAVTVVHGTGGQADPVVRDALQKTFDRMCVYDRPEGC